MYDPARALNIGGQVLRSRAFLAPMAGITDRPGDVQLRKGAFMVLHHAGGRVVGVDRYIT